MENYYYNIETRKDRRLNTGYDYSKTLLKNVLSEEMYNTNSTFLEWLDHINGVVVSLVDAVKNIKIAANIALRKDEKNII